MIGCAERRARIRPRHGTNPQRAASRLSRAASYPLGDPVAESRRVIDHARERGVVLRALGGVAVYLQSPDGRPLLARSLKDVDLVTTHGEGRAMSALLGELRYEGDEMFNALRGARGRPTSIPATTAASICSSASSRCATRSRSHRA